MCELGVARPEVPGDRSEDERTWGHEPPSPSVVAEGGVEDRGRGAAQRRLVTTRSGLSGREERVTQAARGVGAGAGARRGREGGYGERARHIIRVRDGDCT